MMADAENMPRKMLKKELVEAGIWVRHLSTSEKMIKENDAKIKGGQKELNKKAEALKNTLKSESVDEIKKATEELSKVAQESVENCINLVKLNPNKHRQIRRMRYPKKIQKPKKNNSSHNLHA